MQMKHHLQQALLRGAYRSGAYRLIEKVSGGIGAILMLHRVVGGKKGRMRRPRVPTGWAGWVRHRRNDTIRRDLSRAPPSSTLPSANEVRRTCRTCRRCRAGRLGNPHRAQQALSHPRCNQLSAQRLPPDHFGSISAIPQPM
jgi:hypothetical protein